MTIEAQKPRRGRPPKAGRENADTREALIHSGTAMLTEQGFTAAGIDAILRQVGVPKGSFYYYFDSKEAFGKAIIENYAGFFAHRLDKHLLNQALPPLDRLLAFVADAAQGMAKYQFHRGCLIGNLGQEVSNLPLNYRQRLIAILNDWERRVEACLELARQQGTLAAHTDCRALAAYFWVGWEGAVMRAKLNGNAEPLHNFISHFLGGLPRQPAASANSGVKNV